VRNYRVDSRARRFVTLEGYAVEGGLDGPYQPSTCYRPTIALGRHAAPGDAEDLWRDYEPVLDLAATLGIDGVRLSVEWARVEPLRGEVDTAALERYAQVAHHAHSLGLGVTAVIVDAAWPSWLGLEAWLLPWVVPYFIEQARRVVTTMDSLGGVVAFASVDELVTGGFVESSSPPWRRAQRVDAAFARTQIEGIIEALRSDSIVGPKLVTSTRTVSLARPARDVAASLRDATDVEEIYLRSLVKGRGPTQSPFGLLAKGERGWYVAASEELLDALR
jgi:beta-glucosidase/6-phospho-beta-glucosidase/beta-galactosidase